MPNLSHGFLCEPPILHRVCSSSSWRGDCWIPPSAACAQPLAVFMPIFVASKCKYATALRSPDFGATTRAIERLLQKKLQVASLSGWFSPTWDASQSLATLHESMRQCNTGSLSGRWLATCQCLNLKRHPNRKQPPCMCRLHECQNGNWWPNTVFCSPPPPYDSSGDHVQV